MIRIGMAQILIFPENINKNTKTIKEYVKKAVEKSCDIVVFPECSDFGWANPHAIEQAEPIPGNISELLCDLARQNKIYIVCGITEREENKLYNTAVLVDDTGEILLKHRKINLLTGIEDMYSVGDCVRVVNTKFGKIGVAICADNLMESDVIGHTLGRMGCQILLSPSSWAVPKSFFETGQKYGEEWIKPYKKLSETYKMPIVGVSNVGEVPYGAWKGWSCIGNSIATNGRGEVVKTLSFGRKAEELGILEFELIKNELMGTDLSRYAAERRK